jgi:hypothetical protein
MATEYECRLNKVVDRVIDDMHSHQLSLNDIVSALALATQKEAASVCADPQYYESAETNYWATAAIQCKAYLHEVNR